MIVTIIMIYRKQIKCKEAAAMSEASGMVLSQYQTLSTIDDGPNPVVLVRHAISGRLYVKKTLAVYSRPVYDALAALPDTRGIPAIHYLCEEEGRLIIIEDYIHGQTLEDLMALRRLTTGEIFSIMDSLCAVLSRLHHAPVPIVHRDIKPANVIITQEGAVRLIDFNASRLYQPGAGEDTRKLGTPGYAAPEQFGFSQSDARSDIYALGVLLGVMATGRPPQERAGDTAIPRPLGPIAAKCTAMDPDDRYQDVDKLRQDLAKAASKTKGARVLRREAPASAGEPAQASSFLPPGFRSHSVWRMVVAVLGYAMIACVAFGTNPKNPTLVERICECLGFMAAVFFCFDYRGMRRCMPGMNHPKRAVRIVVGSLWALMWLCAFAALYAAFHSLLGW